MLGIDQKVLNEVFMPFLATDKNSKNHELIIYRDSKIENAVKDLIDEKSGFMVLKSVSDGRTRIVTFSNGRKVTVMHADDVNPSIRGFRCGKISFMK